MPGVWHHVTQRGNRQQTVFFEDSDRMLYLRLLQHYATRHGLRLAGYCLMNNHVHLIAIPEREDSLARALGRTHTDYARWLNLLRQETGHVWQNRFYSCPMEDSHAWEALRYVELNPVRAGLVDQAAARRWSSAAPHLTGRDRFLRLDWSDWRLRWTADSWGEALDHGIVDACLFERIRETTRIGRPFGSEEFVNRMERCLERSLRPAKRGPKPMMRGPSTQMNFEVV